VIIDCSIVVVFERELVCADKTLQDACHDAKEGKTVSTWCSSFLSECSSSSNYITTKQTHCTCLSEIIRSYPPTNLSSSSPGQTSPLVRNGGFAPWIVMARPRNWIYTGASFILADRPGAKKVCSSDLSDPAALISSARQPALPWDDTLDQHDSFMRWSI